MLPHSGVSLTPASLCAEERTSDPLGSELDAIGQTCFPGSRTEGLVSGTVETSELYYVRHLGLSWSHIHGQLRSIAGGWGLGHLFLF